MVGCGLVYHFCTIFGFGAQARGHSPLCFVEAPPGDGVWFLSGDGPAQLPAGLGHKHDIVHIPYVDAYLTGLLAPGHLPVKRGQVEAWSR